MESVNVKENDVVTRKREQSSSVGQNEADDVVQTDRLDNLTNLMTSRSQESWSADDYKMRWGLVFDSFDVECRYWTSRFAEREGGYQTIALAILLGHLSYVVFTAFNWVLGNLGTLEAMRMWLIAVLSASFIIGFLLSAKWLVQQSHIILCILIAPFAVAPSLVLSHYSSLVVLDEPCMIVHAMYTVIVFYYFRSHWLVSLVSMAMVHMSYVLFCCFWIVETSEGARDRIMLEAGELVLQLLSGVLFLYIMERRDRWLFIVEEETAWKRLQQVHQFSRLKEWISNLFPEKISSLIDFEEEPSDSESGPLRYRLAASSIESAREVLRGITVLQIELDAVNGEPFSELLDKDKLGIWNSIFLSFDPVVRSVGFEKLKTMSGSYFAFAVDVPAHRGVLLASAIVDVAKKSGVVVQIGMVAGATVFAGILGVKRIQWDMCGDDMNLLGRLVRVSGEGLVTTDRRTRDLLLNESEGDFFSKFGSSKVVISSPSVFDLKGIGDVETFCVSADPVPSLASRERLKTDGVVLPEVLAVQDEYDPIESQFDRQGFARFVFKEERLEKEFELFVAERVFQDERLEFFLFVVRCIFVLLNMRDAPGFVACSFCWLMLLVVASRWLMGGGYMRSHVVGAFGLRFLFLLFLFATIEDRLMSSIFRELAFTTMCFFFASRDYVESVAIVMFVNFCFVVASAFRSGPALDVPTTFYWLTWSEAMGLASLTRLSDLRRVYAKAEQYKKQSQSFDRVVAKGACFIDSLIPWREKLLPKIAPRALDGILSRFDAGELVHELGPSCVVVCDVVNTTETALALDGAQELFNVLNLLYASFDAIADLVGCVPVAMVGDCYIGCALGEGCRLKAALLAFGILASLENREIQTKSGPLSLSVRIGVGAGELWGGIGFSMLRGGFEVWGESRDRAANMEKTGVPNTAHFGGSELEQVCEPISKDGAGGPSKGLLRCSCHDNETSISAASVLPSLSQTSSSYKLTQNELFLLLEFCGCHDLLWKVNQLVKEQTTL